MGKRKFFAYDTDRSNNLDEVRTLVEVDWNDLNNQPFSEDKVVLVDWDGNVTKCEDVAYVDYEGQQMPFLGRVGDCMPFSAAELKACVDAGLYEVEDITAEGYTLRDITIMSEEESEGLYGGDIISFTYRDSIGNGAEFVIINIKTDGFVLEAFGNVVVPKAGLWAVPATDGRVTKFTVNHTKTLDPKYIPGDMCLTVYESGTFDEATMAAIKAAVKAGRQVCCAWHNYKDDAVAIMRYTGYGANAKQMNFSALSHLDRNGKDGGLYLYMHYVTVNEDGSYTYTCQGLARADM